MAQGQPCHPGCAALLRARGLGPPRSSGNPRRLPTSHAAAATTCSLQPQGSQYTDSFAGPYCRCSTAAQGRGGRRGPQRSRDRHSSAQLGTARHSPRRRSSRCRPLGPGPQPVAVPLSAAFPRGAGSGRARPPLCLAARGPSPRPPRRLTSLSSPCQSLSLRWELMAPAGCGERLLPARPSPSNRRERRGLRPALAGRPAPRAPPGPGRAGPGRGQSGGARAAPAEGCAGVPGVRVPGKGPPLLTCASCKTAFLLPSQPLDSRTSERTGRCGERHQGGFSIARMCNKIMYALLLCVQCKPQRRIRQPLSPVIVERCPLWAEISVVAQFTEV